MQNLLPSGWKNFLPFYAHPGHMQGVTQGWTCQLCRPGVPRHLLPQAPLGQLECAHDPGTLFLVGTPGACRLSWEKLITLPLVAHRLGMEEHKIAHKAKGDITVEGSRPLTAAKLQLQSGIVSSGMPNGLSRESGSYHLTDHETV